MKKVISIWFMLSILAGCAAESAKQDTNPLTLMATTDVLLLSDHTLPEHLNLSSGGANGEERRFIDPTIKSLNSKLTGIGLSTYVLNVEDMVADKNITDEETFNAAYAKYDEVLNAAVAANVTILSVHYDANIIKAEDYGTANDYVGGAHVILDDRATSNQTISFAENIIFNGKILEQLNQVGLRIRPNYEQAIRFQQNLTLNIIGHSKGGAALLEIGPQEQAQNLFGSIDNIVTAIDTPLESLATTIKTFRVENKLDN